MTCQNCGHENAPEARFCASCGQPLAGYEGQPDIRQLEQRAGDLRPRDLGDLLNETYNIYRENFWPFIFIGAMPQIPFLIATVNPGPGSVIFSLIGLVVTVLAGGATIYAVAQQYLGHRIDVGECFRQSLQMALMLFAAIILVALALIASAILMLIIIGIPLFFYLLVIWFFAPHVIMIEGRDTISALGRSRDLVRDSWWRVFGIGIIFALILIGLSVVTTLPALAITFVAPVVGSVINAVVSTALFPIVYIGGTLVYLDLRVRKEAYNLDMMASDLRRSQ